MVIEIIGWIGTILLLGAYLLLSRGWLHQEDRLYHSMVFLGALAIGISAYPKENYQIIVVELVFGAVALWAIFRPPKK